MSINIETGRATKTNTGVKGGIDVTFALTIPEWCPLCEDGEHGPGHSCEGRTVKRETMSGECTLLPHEDGRPGYGMWGELDMWLDGSTVEALRGRDDRREIANEIAAACGQVAARFAA